MSELGDIPFDPAGKPGVADSQVGGLHDRIAVEQLTVRLFFSQRIETASEFREKLRSQMFIFQHYRCKRKSRFGSRIAVLHFIGKHAES